MSKEVDKQLIVSSFVVLLGYSIFAVLGNQSLKPDPEPAQAISVVEQTENNPEVSQETKQENKNEKDKEVVLTDCEKLDKELAKYDWDTKLMKAIVMAESSCRADAVGDKTLTYQNNGRTYGYSVGMFQIRILEGREACDTFDIEKNAQCAYNIYKSQGLKAWSVYSNGAYKKYM